MKIYLSGKITGLSVLEYVTNFNGAKRELYKLYPKAEFINPIGINPYYGIKRWLFYMIADLKALRKCSHIAMQKNWIDSKGAYIEYGFAKWIFNLQIIWL